MRSLTVRTIVMGGIIALLGPAQQALAEEPPPAESVLGSPTDTSAPKVPTDPNHLLHPQDVLRVQVFQEDDINKQCNGLAVTQDSTITLPLIGVISVKGLTVRDAQELIRTLYDKEYLVNPQVSVLVLKYAERSVNVIGSVTKQGRIQFPDSRDLSIVDALALAQGQTRLADLKRVKLTRRNEKGESTVTEIDVDAMMKKRGAPPIMLQPGDVIFVPERVL